MHTRIYDRIYFYIEPKFTFSYNNIIYTKMIGDIKVYGTIVAVLPVQTGISKSGSEWKKAEYVLETMEQYPRKVKFDVFGSDRVEQYTPMLVQNAVVTISVNIESREFNGRWYTDIRAWKVENGDTRAEGTAAPVPNPGYVSPIVPEEPSAAPAFVTEPVVPQFSPTPNPSDDLPF